MIETALAVVRILTGVLLTVSAYGKFLQDYGAGVSDVLGYRIVRRPVAEAIAFALPVVEMLLAACLVLGLLLPGCCWRSSPGRPAASCPAILRRTAAATAAFCAHGSDRP